jgi:hypothetical protein
MYLLNVGDHVRLRLDLEVSGGALLRMGAKGHITACDERGYTVNFEGDEAPVTALSDDELELNP